MEKRLSTSDYVLVLAFIFMFFCIIGAFFFGLQMGKDKTEEKYELMLAEEQDEGAAAASSLSAYDQQQFISFYHMVYEPYRVFQNKWFEQMNKLDKQTQSDDVTAMLKDLKKESQDAYGKLKQMTASPSSPLLISSQEKYMTSLQQFSSSIDELVKMKWDEADPLATLSSNETLQKAQNFALAAEADFYEAITKWHERYEYRMNDIELVQKQNLTMKEWNGLSINYKNKYISSYMEQHHMFKPYTAHDLTAQIDLLLTTTGAEALNWNSVDQAVRTVESTKAVRPGDFEANQTKLYDNEMLIQIPLFTDTN